MPDRVVMFSGGLVSWGTAKRVVERHGAADLTLLFTDTRIEDPDLYRFLEEAAADVFRNMPARLVRLADGRTPWEVFRDRRMIGNTNADICSRILKRELADRWLKEHCDPADTVVYVGLDWTEEHRFDDGQGGGARHRYRANGWRAEAPLTERPYLDRRDLKAMLQQAGIRIPRLYELGFEHNNCGGFCIKAGQAHFAHLLRTLPARYAWHEDKEEEIRVYLGKDVAILRDRRGGETRPMTLRQFRERIEAGGQYDLFDLGGCGCFVE
jgi:3'-phosphoadenosine 5'-phosphosulfate sulfotransferase (PAPS reductase)/FAD synthetase